MTKTRALLVPAYMERFSCIGTECEDTCCAGWNVTIDRATYKKYNKVRSDLKPSLDKYVKRNRSSKSDMDYARIEMVTGFACPMLNEKKLCSVQLKLGEDYLSNVCSTYPRITNIVNGIFEKSATMSCPEAARLALLNPKGMEFNEIEESVEVRNSFNKRLSTASDQPNGSVTQFFWELRIFSIQVLQNRSYSLAERLIILGLFYQKVQTYISLEQFAEIPDLIASYMNLLQGNGVSDIINGIPSLSIIQMELLKNLADTRVIQGIRSQRYFECYSEFLQGIQYTKEVTVEEISSRYQTAYDNFYLPFMNNNEYVLENYLVNYVYTRLFPLGNGNDVFEDYMMMIIHYAMIKMHLIGMAGYHKDQFSLEHVIKLIQSFAKTIEHNNSYLREIRQLLDKNGFNTMAYMAILIKNN